MSFKIVRMIEATGNPREFAVWDTETSHFVSDTIGRQTWRGQEHWVNCWRLTSVGKGPDGVLEIIPDWTRTGIAGLETLNDTLQRTGSRATSAASASSGVNATILSFLSREELLVHTPPADT